MTQQGPNEGRQSTSDGGGSDEHADQADDEAVDEDDQSWHPERMMKRMCTHFTSMVCSLVVGHETIPSSSQSIIC